MSHVDPKQRGQKRGRAATKEVVTINAIYVFCSPLGLEIKRKLDLLYRRLFENGEWHRGERLEVQSQLRLARLLICEEDVPDHAIAETERRLLVLTQQYRIAYVEVVKKIVVCEHAPLQQLRELCMCLSARAGAACQSTNEADLLYQSAAAIKPAFDHVLSQIADRLALPLLRADSGVTSGVVLWELRDLAQVMEKVMCCADPSGQGHWDTSCDIVRATVVVPSISRGNDVLRALLTSEEVQVVITHESYSCPNDSGWADVRAVLFLIADLCQHKCEVRIVHQDFAFACEQLGGHSAYAIYRRLRESLELPRSIRIMARKTSIPAACINTDTVSGPDLLYKFADIPLSHYVDDGHHLHVNIDFPGLRAIHRDPWIFVVPNLLSSRECEQLMMKAGAHMRGSERDAARGAAHRNSMDCRVAKQETVGLQSRYAKLFDVPLGNLEAIKLTRYRQGQYFKNHVDPIADMAGFENRVGTLIVYLNTCKRGGETRFLSLPSHRLVQYEVGEKVCALIDGEGDYPGIIEALNDDGTVNFLCDDGDFRPSMPREEVRAYETLTIEPVQGMGVLFFPAYLPTSPKAQLLVKQLDRHLTHESCKAAEEKFIQQQWVWPKRSQCHTEGVTTNGILL